MLQGACVPLLSGVSPRAEGMVGVTVQIRRDKVQKKRAWIKRGHDGGEGESKMERKSILVVSVLETVWLWFSPGYLLTYLQKRKELQVTEGLKESKSWKSAE